MLKKLAEWSQKEFSDLPWRKNRTLFGTLVSEIMLQQTTVSTALKHYERFLDEYPDTYAVANATDEQLTISWKGLGYYRRARNLKKACEHFCEHHDGSIPLEYEALIKAPGVGEYTANAILAIGANKRALALDANLERVLARIYAITAPKGPKLLKELAGLFERREICEEMDAVGPRAFNEALMDLGRNYCKANKAVCELCHLRDSCAAQKQSPLDLPVKSGQKKKESYHLVLLRLLCEKDGKILAIKKRENQWLSGQYELPTFVLESEDPNLKQYPLLDFHHHHFLPEYKTLITKYKIANKVLAVDEKDLSELNLCLKGYEWKELSRGSNWSTASLKAIRVFE